MEDRNEADRRRREESLKYPLYTDMKPDSDYYYNLDGWINENQ